MDRDKIIKYLKQYKNKNKYNIERIGFFGSFAKNTANNKSDIDVVVALKKQDLFDIIGIKQDLEEGLKFSVDIVSYREKMNSFLKNRIDKEAIYVW